MTDQTCPYCGQSHRPGARFCPTTGKPLPADSGAVTPFLDKLVEAGGEAAVPPAPAAPETASQPIAAPAVAPAASGVIPAAKAEPDQAKGAAGQTGKLPPNSFLCSRYIIVHKAGHGGMAAVYQALDTQRPGAPWAIKEMSDAAIKNIKDREYAIQSFEQEAQLLKKLNHPNLPKVTDAFTEGGKHYLVMEFVVGQTLQTMLESRTQPFEEAEVLPIAMQLCEVMYYLHNQIPKIIFRDLKPSNIMLTPQGQVKLIDFGIARFFKPGKMKDTMALGTPGYAAPEAAGGQTDERSDLYSLCITLHQMLTLHDPCRTLFNLPAARKLNPKISTGMEAVLTRGLQNEREKRWHDMTAMRVELARLVQASLPPTAAIPSFEVVPSGVEVAASTQPGHRPAKTVRAEPPPAAGLQAAMPPTPARTVMAGAPPPVSSYAPPAPGGTARPTTRLLMVATQLSGRRLALFVALALVVLVAGAWLLAPILDEAPIDWNNVPFIAVFGALGYAALPRRGIAFASHALLSTALVSTIWARLGAQGYSWGFLLLGAVVSGLVMEGWVYFLPRIKDAAGQVWVREVLWIAGMAVIGTTLFFVIVTQGMYGLSPVQWMMSAILGAAGWFLGDLVQQYLVYKRTGLWRER